MAKAKTEPKRVVRLPAKPKTLPLIVVAYLGGDGWMPSNQPYWAYETQDIEEARRWADETWDWWFNSHSAPDDLDNFCVGVWRQEYEGGLDFPTPMNALYLRGRWVEEE